MEEISFSAEQQTASMEEITATANKLGDLAESLVGSYVKQSKDEAQQIKHKNFEKTDASGSLIAINEQVNLSEPIDGS
jgi:ElaB/YqjD/DUF883 family membrane-anchored ribosome-binding protein